MVLASTQSLIKYQDMMLLWSVKIADFSQLLFTFIITLVTGIANGIIISVAFSLVLLIYRSFQPRITKLGRLPGTDVFVDAARYPQTRQVPSVVVLRVDGELNFGNVKVVTKYLLNMLHEHLAAIGGPENNAPEGEEASSSSGMGCLPCSASDAALEQSRDSRSSSVASTSGRRDSSTRREKKDGSYTDKTQGPDSRRSSDADIDEETGLSMVKTKRENRPSIDDDDDFTAALESAKIALDRK